MDGTAKVDGGAMAVDLKYSVSRLRELCGQDVGFIGCGKCFTRRCKVEDMCVGEVSLTKILRQARTTHRYNSDVNGDFQHCNM